MSRAWVSASCRASCVRAFVRRRKALTLEKVSSIGEKSGEVQPLLVVDNSDVAPSPLTSHCDAPYDKQTILATPFKQRGFVCLFMCSCSCLRLASYSFWRCCGGLTGSRFGLPLLAGPSAARFTVSSSPVAQMIALPVVSPPPPRQVEAQRLLLYAPGAR